MIALSIQISFPVLAYENADSSTLTSSSCSHYFLFGVYNAIAIACVPLRVVKMCKLSFTIHQKPDSEFPQLIKARLIVIIVSGVLHARLLRQKFLK